MVEGINTMALKWPPMRRTRPGSPSRNSSTSLETASAKVAVPCRMMSGKPASNATRRSVWIGFQMCAHSV